AQRVARTRCAVGRRTAQRAACARRAARTFPGEPIARRANAGTGRSLGAGTEGRDPSGAPESGRGRALAALLRVPGPLSRVPRQFATLMTWCPGLSIDTRSP